jgi:dehydrogenase/reductase SDR family member 1
LVTGASRGVGKGIALELCAAGATVYVTGRSIKDMPHFEAGFESAENQKAGEYAGQYIVIECDHRDDQQTRAVLAQIQAEQGHLDILVNNVWGGYENMVEEGEFTWTQPFWKQPLWRWDTMFQAGVRAHYVTSQWAVPLMLAQSKGLIVNISYWAAQKYIGNVAYGVAKAATDKMTADMAHDLLEHDVAVVSLYPGLVRTEKVMKSAAWFDLSNSESPEFMGRTVVALASDVQIMQKTGKILIAAAEARAYGFTDIDGKSPRPLTLEEA